MSDKSPDHPPWIWSQHFFFNCLFPFQLLDFQADLFNGSEHPFLPFFYLFCNSNYFLLRREWTIVEKAKKYFPRYSVRHEICRSVFLDGASSRPSQMGKCTAELKVGLLMPMPDNNSRKWATARRSLRLPSPRHTWRDDSVDIQPLCSLLFRQLITDLHLKFI